MSPARQIVIAACASALGLGFVACATAGGDVGDLDAGQDQEAGGSTTPDAGTKPLKKDAGGGGGGGDTDSGQVVDPDASTCVKAAPSNKCGVAPQCGCALTETCDVQDNAGNVNCIAAGTAGPGKSCTTTAGCALGSTCIGNACKPYCPAGTSTDGGGGACGLTGTSTCVQIGAASTPIPNLKVCRAACDLTNATSCDQANAIPGLVIGCDLDSTNQPDCFKTNSNMGSCLSDGICAPAYVCATLANDAGSACKKWCKVGPKSATCGGVDCPSFGPKILVNGVEYGACP